MPPPRILVVHPPVSIARDFIDYPYLADFGAVQLAPVLPNELPHANVELRDAYALPGADLQWRPDGRARLGVDPQHLLGSITLAPACVVVPPAPFPPPA